MSCEVVFAKSEWQAVYPVSKRKQPPEKPPDLNDVVRMVAELGGFLGRKGDNEPGPKTLWIGLQHARDFVWALVASKATTT